MKIILSDKEYLALRPNVFRDEFIEKIRGMLEKKQGDQRSDAGILDEIQNAFVDYDKEVTKPRDNYFLLWPTPQD